MSDYKSDARASRNDKLKKMGCFDDGGAVLHLDDKAADAMEAIKDSMRAGANNISNDPNKESPDTYSARLRMRGDRGEGRN